MRTLLRLAYDVLLGIVIGILVALAIAELWWEWTP